MAIKKGKWDRISIMWIDSSDIRLTGKSWHSFKEIEKHMAEENHKGYYILSTGYKFHQTKDFVLIARDMSFEDDSPVLFGGVIAIPKGCILSIKKI